MLGTLGTLGTLTTTTTTAPAPAPALTISYLPKGDEFVVTSTTTGQALRIWARETLQGVIERNAAFFEENGSLTIYSMSEEQQGTLQLTPWAANML